MKCSECGNVGEYKNVVPMPVLGRVQYIDRCVADLVAALNAANITTVASCCGHGDPSKAFVMLEDGRVLQVFQTKDQWEDSIRVPETPPLVDDVPMLPMPKTCTRCEYNGYGEIELKEQNGFIVCPLCFYSYGEAR